MTTQVRGRAAREAKLEALQEQLSESVAALAPAAVLVTDGEPAAVAIAQRNAALNAAFERGARARPSKSALSAALERGARTRR